MNRNNNDDRRSRVNVAHGDPSNWRVPFQRQEVHFKDMSTYEEEEFEIESINNSKWMKTSG